MVVNHLQSDFGAAGDRTLVDGPPGKGEMKTVQKIAILVFTITVTLDQFHFRANLESAPSKRYAVIGCSTPERNSHRSYDYAFYLPLTVWAWRRIGFESIVLIIGTRKEWVASPILSIVLEHLERLKTTVLFVDAAVDNRSMLGQTSRLFVFNMEGFPGQDDDYLITSDSDLWPLRLEHFAPRTGYDLVLVHSECCGYFKLRNERYQMIPMSHVGAKVSVWKQMINDGHLAANDSTTILDYLEDRFGPRVRKKVKFASRQWFYDQLTISIRLSEWIERNTNQTIYRVSDEGFDRVDRIDWFPEWLDAESFKLQYDVHLPLELYLPPNWASIQPLIRLMYDDRKEIGWFDGYVLQFYRQVNSTVVKSVKRRWWF